MNCITDTIMPHKTIIRLSGVARNPANGFPARLLVLQRRFLNLVSFLGGNCFAEGKATKLSSVWSGRHEEVLKVP